MRILIAEDDAVSRRVLEATLRKWGFEVVAACDGGAAWEAFQREDAPMLAILDWMMPVMDGVEICRRVRATPQLQAAYLILLTAKGCCEDVVLGLKAGADDYVTKPFDQEELRARVQVGVRIMQLQGKLAMRIKELEEALLRVKQLQGLLPICSYCKKIRDDQNYWQQVESYITAHSEVKFSHGICPPCYDKYLKPEIESWNARE